MAYSSVYCLSCAYYCLAAISQLTHAQYGGARFSSSSGQPSPTFGGNRGGGAQYGLRQSPQFSQGYPSQQQPPPQFIPQQTPFYPQQQGQTPTNSLSYGASSAQQQFGTGSSYPSQPSPQATAAQQQGYPTQPQQIVSQQTSASYQYQQEQQSLVQQQPDQPAPSGAAQQSYQQQPSPTQQYSGGQQQSYGQQGPGQQSYQSQPQPGSGFPSSQSPGGGYSGGSPSPDSGGATGYPSNASPQGPAYSGGGGTVSGYGGPSGSVPSQPIGYSQSSFGSSQTAGSGGYGGSNTNNMPPSSCKIDPCFTSQANCALARSLPFDRRTPISCEECAALCKSLVNANPPYQCKSAVYDKTYQSCDVFAVDGRAYPLVAYPNRDYFQPGPTCASGGTNSGGYGPPTAVPPSAGDSCPAGQESRYLFIQGYTLSDSSGKDFPSVSLQQCLQACTQNLSPKGSESLTCQSFNYNQQSSTCRIIKNAAAPKGSGQLQQTANAGYYERVCLPSNLVKGCGNIFERVPQSILVGFARSVVDAKSFEQCLDSCLNSQQLFGFKCLSGMYYYEEPNQNCILNTMTKDTQPDLFVAEQKDVEDYFQLDCGAKGGSGRKKASALQKFISQRKQQLKKFNKEKLYDVLSSNPELRKGMNEWTEWSVCDLQLYKKVRFRRCIESDVRACPMERQPCTKHPASIVRDVPEPPDIEDTSFSRQQASSQTDSRRPSAWQRRTDFDADARNAAESAAALLSNSSREFVISLPGASRFSEKPTAAAWIDMTTVIDGQNSDVRQIIDLVPVRNNYFQRDRPDTISPNSRRRKSHPIAVERLIDATPVIRDFVEDQLLLELSTTSSTTTTSTTLTTTASRPSNLNQFRDVCRCAHNHCTGQLRCDLGMIEWRNGTRNWCANPRRNLPPLTFCLGFSRFS